MRCSKSNAPVSKNTFTFVTTIFFHIIQNNLLGNLLCAVAKLLDGNGNAVGRLVKLLNDILGDFDNLT
jgi:hypothetical protein